MTCFCAKIISSILNIVAVFHALISLAVEQTGTAANVFVIKKKKRGVYQMKEGPFVFRWKLSGLCFSRQFQIRLKWSGCSFEEAWDVFTA